MEFTRWWVYGDRRTALVAVCGWWSHWEAQGSQRCVTVSCHGLRATGKIMWSVRQHSFAGTFFLVVKTEWSSSPVKFLWRSDLWYCQIIYLGIAGLRSVGATQRHGETQPCGPTLFLSICFWPKRYPFHKLLLKKKIIKIKIKINKNMVPL